MENSGFGNYPGPSNPAGGSKRSAWKDLMERSTVSWLRDNRNLKIYGQLQDFRSLEDGLKVLESTHAGRGLLGEIKRLLVQKNQTLVIGIGTDHGISTTTYQSERGVDSIANASNGIGTGAKLRWNSRHAPASLGTAFSPPVCFALALMNQLKHVFILLNGAATPGFPYALNDYARAIGLGKFQNAPFSENALRRELNLSPRTGFVATFPYTGVNMIDNNLLAHVATQDNLTVDLTLESSGPAAVANPKAMNLICYAHSRV